MKNLAKLEKKLGVNFKNKNLLVQALVHRSYLNENTGLKLENNERLEFLGDAVLEHIVTDYLYLNYPQKSEGELTSWRASLVNTKMLFKKSQELGFNDFLLLSAGEIKENGRSRYSILANTFEAFIGALYLDQGFDVCKDFVNKYLIKELGRIIEEKLYKDAKSKFQEKAQEIKGITPSYEILEQWGPDHKKTFLIGLFLKKDLIAKGRGSSKQEAEEAAAEKALKIKNW